MEAAASSSNRGGGRMDDLTYAEALRAVSTLEQLGSETHSLVTGVTDNIEGMLLESLEAAEKFGAEQPNLTSKTTERGEISGRRMSIDDVFPATPYELIGEEAEVTFVWKNLCRQLWASIQVRFSAEVVQSLIMLPLILVVVRCLH